MHRLLLLFYIFYSAALCWAQRPMAAGTPPPVLAIMPFTHSVADSQANYAGILRDHVEACFASSGRFKVVERRQVDNLAGIAATGQQLTDSASTSLGGLLGASWLVLGHIDNIIVSSEVDPFKPGVLCYTASLGFTLRLVDVQSSEILTGQQFTLTTNKGGHAVKAAGRGLILAGALMNDKEIEQAGEKAEEAALAAMPHTPIDALDRALKRINDHMHFYILSNFPLLINVGAIVRQTEHTIDELEVDAGAQQALAHDDQLKVVQVQERLIKGHKITSTDELALLRVEAVKGDTLSLCHVLKGHKELKKAYTDNPTQVKVLYDGSHHLNR